MKLSLLNSLVVLFAFVAVIHAQDNPLCHAGPGFEIFCAETPDQLDVELFKALSQINPTASANGVRKRQVIPLLALQLASEKDVQDYVTGVAKKKLQEFATEYGCITKLTEEDAKKAVDDVVKYFKTYLDSIILVGKGQIDQGLFNQLKNVGSWCTNDSCIVTLVKKLISNSKTIGPVVALTCDCIDPLIRNYESFTQLVDELKIKDIAEILPTCAQGIRDVIGSRLKGGKGGNVGNVGKGGKM